MNNLLKLKKLLFLSFIAPLLIQLGCSTNQATGERHFNLVSESQEIEMGKEADAQISAQMGIYNDPQLQAYVEGIGKRMAQQSERPNLPWSFKIIDDESVNAFALPGGYIYVTRGILTHLNSEAELAGVIGHEIGHVTAKHSVYKISEAQLANLGLGVAMILKPELQQYAGLANLGLGLLFLKFGRDDEREADELGLRYMQKTNHDPRELKDVMSTLDKVSQQAGGGSMPQWLSTHPNPQNRIELIEQNLQKQGGSYDNMNVGRDEYMAKINNLVYGKDPKQGFFVGNTFYHPQLNFQMQYPSGWNYVNSANSVTAVSPNQDAVIQLQLAAGGSPQEAARSFFGQQGISAQPLQNTTINGNPAVNGNFSAQTEQGTIAGTASFIQYGGNVYQIISYTSQSAFSGFQPAFSSSVNDFRRLSNNSYTGVQPKTVNVITVNEQMTLQQFNTKYPSTVPLQTLALVNGMDASAVIQPGQKVKQITGAGIPE